MPKLTPISFDLVWFDSLGAKSSCTLVRTSDISILIDPGIAMMHPRFPASEADKARWQEEGFQSIKRASRKADVVVISHYHYDHFTDFDSELYRRKRIFAKSPNNYINESQRSRAEAFFTNLYQHFGGGPLENLLQEKEEREYADTMDSLRVAKSKRFGDYDKRRKRVLRAGARWFRNRTKSWNKWKQIPALKLKGARVDFADGATARFGGTVLRFTEALFHGVEYSRVGWVLSTVVEKGRDKLIHTSDVNGPIIEDYAEWIIKEKPRVVILDGPMTYMLGYVLNVTNLKRAVENAVKIVRESSCELMIYDHHLPREASYLKHTAAVWEAARKSGKQVMTAAEYLGKRPVALISSKTSPE